MTTSHHVKGETNDKTPVVGNMNFQLCGGVQSTLASLEAIVFEYEQKLMETGTEQATLTFQAQGTESQNAYAAGKSSADSEESNLQLESTKSFVNAGVTAGTTIGQFTHEKLSSGNKEMDTLSKKAEYQQKMLDEAKKPATAATGAVGPNVASTTPKTLTPRQQELINLGADTEKPGDAQEIAGLEQADKDKVAAKTQENLKSTRTEINTKEMELSNRRQMYQTASNFGQQIVTASVTLAQAPVAFAKGQQQAVATVQNQAASSASQTAQTAAKMRETAADEAKNAATALVQAMNVRA